VSDNRRKFEKIIAVAISPGAYEDEAIAALHKARALVQEDSSLAHPEPAAPPQPEQGHSYQTQISNIKAIRLPIIMAGLSIEAYGLGLKNKLELIIVQGGRHYTLDVRVDGSKVGCKTFKRYVNSIIKFHNNYHIDGEV
jgi:hypothetical protein